LISGDASPKKADVNHKSEDFTGHWGRTKLLRLTDRTLKRKKELQLLL
jgi:hypothetical protein